MANTLPTFTQRMDDAFIDTWYEVRETAIDNVLEATVVWNALVAAGCMDTQVGGNWIERTIKYNVSTATDVQKGDELPSGEPELETEALWRWKYIAAHVQRNLFDDQKNAGPAKRKDYVGKRVQDARDALEQRFETNITSAFKATETGRQFQSLNDMIPPRADRTTGTYGGIARPSAYVTEANGVEVPDPAGINPWWGPKYFRGALATIDTDLLDDMKVLFNSTSNNQQHPNLIIGTQTMIEIYEDEAIDISQIVKDETTRLADLGFTVFRFKGQPFIWADGIDANNLLMLNTDWIEIIYDPNMWFDMTDWKPGQKSADRIAHILCALNAISAQLRRHSRLDYA